MPARARVTNVVAQGNAVLTARSTCSGCKVGFDLEDVLGTKHRRSLRLGRDLHRGANAFFVWRIVTRRYRVSFWGSCHAVVSGWRGLK